MSDKDKSKDTLRGLLKELADENADKAAVEEREAELAKMVENNADLKTRLEKLEAAPAKKISFGSDKGNVDFMYHGYDLRKQGRFLNVGRKVEFADDDQRERFAKTMILSIQEARGEISKAALQEGTTTEGGYLVDDEFMAGIFGLARQQSVALQDCRIVPMGGDTLYIATENAAVSVVWTAEEVAATESEPTIAQTTLTATRLDAYSIMSNELLDDAKIDIVAWLTDQFSEAIGQEIDNQVFNGSGSPFAGAMANAGNSINLTTSGTITEVDCSNAISQLPTNHAAGAKFYLNRKPFHLLRSLKTTDGVPIFTRPGDMVPGTIYEYPYSLVEQMPTSLAVAADTAVGLFGNLAKNYYIGQRQGIKIALDPYYLFTSNQTRFRVTSRWDGAAVGANGLVVIKTFNG